MTSTAAVFLDRIEGTMAVMTREDGEAFDLPRSLLPEGAREGEWLRLSLEVDIARSREEAEAIRRRRSRLTKDDDGGDFSL